MNTAMTSPNFGEESIGGSNAPHIACYVCSQSAAKTLYITNKDVEGEPLLYKIPLCLTCTEMIKNYKASSLRLATIVDSAIPSGKPKLNFVANQVFKYGGYFNDKVEPYWERKEEEEIPSKWLSEEAEEEWKRRVYKKFGYLAFQKGKIIIKYKANTATVEGNTYSIKELLKEIGLKWDPNIKAWKGKREVVEKIELDILLYPGFEVEEVEEP